MSEFSMVKVIEDLNERVTKLSAENLAFQQAITAIIATMPPEQSSAAKRHLEEVISFVEKGGSSAAVEMLAVQKPIYQMLFLHAK
ncbi:hypothetical protein GTGU_00278 [Trabulsiella guamensis ATCC 49490]|uniref:Uncharacterized protein n=1 Tax=Trabulsiella guamensis ATCC 49490 TaxID=1005994 RepID=A0A085AR17_9ENTR|nr:hypothetical protein [Trabulsiella guamensis]KFC12662.1 hypothetical protein GTGU_00278 [Trabulsiella guamensis ATCC 49490]